MNEAWRSIVFLLGIVALFFPPVGTVIGILLIVSTIRIEVY